MIMTSFINELEIYELRYADVIRQEIRGEYIDKHTERPHSEKKGFDQNKKNEVTNNTSMHSSNCYIRM